MAIKQLSNFDEELVPWYKRCKYLRYQNILYDAPHGSLDLMNWANKNNVMVICDNIHYSQNTGNHKQFEEIKDISEITSRDIERGLIGADVYLITQEMLNGAHYDSMLLTIFLQSKPYDYRDRSKDTYFEILKDNIDDLPEGNQKAALKRLANIYGEKSTEMRKAIDFINNSTHSLGRVEAI